MNVTQLMHQLQHGERPAREEAFDHIARSFDPALLGPLAALAQPDDPRLEILLCQYLMNLQPDDSIPHLLELAGSPNQDTRQYALQVLVRIDIKHLLQPLIQLLSSVYPDVRMYALRTLGLHRRTTALNAIHPLLASADQKLAQAAFDAVAHIDSPRSTGVVERCLQSSEPWRQVAALNALGTMQSFERWKRLQSCLDAADVQIRYAAVHTISRRGGHKAVPVLVQRLEQEPEEEVAKLIINRLALHPGKEMAAVLLRLATTHPNPQLRRPAGWVLEELDSALLKDVMVDMLDGAEEPLKAYILTRMGTRQLPGSGRLLVQHLSAGQTNRIRCAALEGLGFLRQRRYLPVVVPFIDSEDPMTAYVATLTAVQLVDRLHDSPELVRLLMSTDRKRNPLRQIVLQYMIDALDWNYDDADLARILVLNLGSENENIAYLSAVLLGQCRGNLELVEPLLEAVNAAATVDIQLASRQSLNQVLDGDLTPLLEQIVQAGDDPVRMCALAELLSTLDWGPESAAAALPVFDRLSCPADLPQASHVRRELARGLYRAAPAACRQYFFQVDGDHDDWRQAIGHAWLETLGGLQTPDERSDWQSLFAAADAELAAAAARHAVAAGASWTVEPMISRATQKPHNPVSRELRQSVRQLTSL